MPRPAHREPDTILYGCAYYHEYMPHERLAEDVRLMQEIGFNTMRLGESTWSLWEPEDGVFEFAWIDRVVDALHAAGIRVILGTPTYALPPWLARKHPEIIAVSPTDGRPVPFGLRQQIDVAHAAYRFHAERIVRAVVERFAAHPAVIGWQIDNETQNGGAANHAVEAAFITRLRRRFGTPAALNQAWGLNYWGQSIRGFEEIWPRRGTISPSHKLEWERHQQDQIEEYLRWHAELVQRLKRPDQFVTLDFCGANFTNVRADRVAAHLDVAAINPYHGSQDDHDGHSPVFQGDLCRSWKRRSYLVTETNAQTTGWDSKGQFPPYDGQLRLNVYTNIATGADQVEYWHWHSAHAGQEIYWKGILGHDLQPNRVSREAQRTAQELRRIGPRLVGTRHDHQVAILHSVDAIHGLTTQPMSDKPPMDLLWEAHRGAFRLNVGTDFCFPDDTDLARWKVLIVPCLYVADDALLHRLEAYVRGGGHLILWPKSGCCTEHNTVRPVRQPGILRQVCGASYQEFSTLKQPLPLKDLAFAHTGENQARTWCEFLESEGAEVLARIDHPFFGRWAAITRQSIGAGSATYVGTLLSDDLWQSLLRDLLQRAGVAMPQADAPSRLRYRSAVNRFGRRLHYYLNCNGDERTVIHRGANGRDLLGDAPVSEGQPITLAAWAAAIVEESA